jgi:PhzF family phenazine biosynthesis protein
MESQFFLVNAFTNQPFAGNPAAIVLLDQDQSDEWMKACAREFNQPITTFVTKEQEGYRLRWFTPSQEIDLCGHGTLCAAHIIYEEISDESQITFHTRAGILTAEQLEEKFKLTFQIKKTKAIPVTEQFKGVINHSIKKLAWAEDRYIIELEGEDAVHTAIPNLDRLKELDGSGLIITAKSSKEYDFVSRYFAPKIGVNEDFVTGSAHCALASYWGKELNKDEFFAFQDSTRGGEMKIKLNEDNVEIIGEAITIVKGNLTI